MKQIIKEIPPHGSQLAIFIDHTIKQLPLNQIVIFIDEAIGEYHMMLKLKKYYLLNIENAKWKNHYYYYEGLYGVLIIYCLMFVFEDNKNLVFTNYFDVSNKKDLHNLEWIAKINRKAKVHLASDLNEYLGNIEIEHHQQDEINFFIDRSKIYYNQLDKYDFKKTITDFSEEFSLLNLMETYCKDPKSRNNPDSTKNL